MPEQFANLGALIDAWRDEINDLDRRFRLQRLVWLSLDGNVRHHGILYVSSQYGAYSIDIYDLGRPAEEMPVAEDGED